MKRILACIAVASALTLGGLSLSTPAEAMPIDPTVAATADIATGAQPVHWRRYYHRHYWRRHYWHRHYYRPYYHHRYYHRWHRRYWW